MLLRRALWLSLAGVTLGLLSAPPSTRAQPDASIAGVVTTKVARPRPLRVTTDDGVCGKELPDDSIAVDSTGHLANAVVIVTGLKAPAGPALEPQILNSKCAFVPRVQVARPGAMVKVSSQDAVLHNTNLVAPTGASIFNVGLPAPGVSLSRRLAAQGVIKVACNVHTWMQGWVVATDEVAAVTGPDGRFSLTGVPPGAYTLRIWHESLAEQSAQVTVTAGKPAEIAVDLSAKR